MKTTLELPDSLMKQVKMRALQQGQKLKDAVADLLRKGLASSRHSTNPANLSRSSKVTSDPETGLPLVVCKPGARASKMTADELIAIEKEILAKQDLERLGLSS